MLVNIDRLRQKRLAVAWQRKVRYMFDSEAKVLMTTFAYSSICSLFDGWCVILVAPACWLLVALSHTISPFSLNTGKFHLSVCLRGRTAWPRSRPVSPWLSFPWGMAWPPLAAFFRGCCC